MDSLSAEIVRFTNQYEAALASLSDIFDTLKTSDAHALKVALLESGILERALRREETRQKRIEATVAPSQGEDEANRLLSSSSSSATPSPAASRLQVASELLLKSNHSIQQQQQQCDHKPNGHLQAPSPSSSINGYVNRSSVTPLDVFVGVGEGVSTAMMSVEQRNIVQLKLQIMFEDLGLAVRRLKSSLNGGSSGGGRAGKRRIAYGAADSVPSSSPPPPGSREGMSDYCEDNRYRYGNQSFEQSDEEDDEDYFDDYQLLRHHVFPNGTSGGTHSNVSKSKTAGGGGGIVASRGLEAAVSSSTSSNRKRGGGGGGNFLKSLQQESRLPTAITDLQILCEDLHEKLFTETQKLRVSEAQKEELLFRLNAREEALRGLRSHFLKQLVGSVGTAVASGALNFYGGGSSGGNPSSPLLVGGGGGSTATATGGGSNTNNANTNNNNSSTSVVSNALTTSVFGTNNPARFAGIPITFIEEADIEVARRIASAQLELDAIRSQHGKELWRQREGWAKRLEAKEKEIIQMQIMFRNALAALQGRHASTVTRIAEENANLKENNVKVEHLALQRAEAFFEMKLNEKVAQLTVHYEGKLSLVADKLAAANNAFKQSLLELASERKAKRKLQNQLFDAERALDHALVVEIPSEADRASSSAFQRLRAAERTNERLTALLSVLETEKSEQAQRHDESIAKAKEEIHRLEKLVKSLEQSLEDEQNQNERSQKTLSQLKHDVEEKDKKVRSLLSEVAVYREKFLSLESPSAFLNEHFKFGTEVDDENEDEDEKEKKREQKFAAIQQKNELLAHALQQRAAAAEARAASLEEELNRMKKEEADQLLFRAKSEEVASQTLALAELRTQLENVQARYDSANDKCDEYRKHIAALNNTILTLQNELESVRGHLSEDGKKLLGEGDEALLSASSSFSARRGAASPERPLSVGSTATATPSLLHPHPSFFGNTTAVGGSHGSGRNLHSSSLRAGNVDQNGANWPLTQPAPAPPTVSMGCDTMSLLNLDKNIWDALIAVSAKSSKHLLLANGKGEERREEGQKRAAVAFLESLYDFLTQNGVIQRGKGKRESPQDHRTRETQAPTPDGSSFRLVGFGDESTKDLYLRPERMLNATLRNKLADLHVQLKIAQMSEFELEGYYSHFSSSRPLHDDGETDDNTKNKSKSKKEKETTTVCEEAPTVNRQHRRSSSGGVSSGRRSSNGATNVDDASVTCGTPLTPFLSGDLPTAPVPLSLLMDISKENISLQNEIRRLSKSLGEALEHRRLLLLSSKNRQRGSGGSYTHEERAPPPPLPHPSVPPLSSGGARRPLSAFTRYSLNAMPLPSGRLSVASSSGGGGGNHRPNSASSSTASSATTTTTKHGAGFYNSPRRPKKPLSPAASMASASGQQQLEKPMRGKAPLLEPYSEDMGVYDDDEEGEGDGDAYDQLFDGDENVHQTKEIMAVVEAYFLKKRNTNDNEDDEALRHLLYDGEGNPRYIYGFLPRKYQKLLEKLQLAEEEKNKTVGARSSSRPASASAAVLRGASWSGNTNNSRNTASFSNFGLGIGGGRWASLQSENNTKKANQQREDYEDNDDEDTGDESTRKAQEEYAKSHLASQHEATCRYIQPASFFAVKGRLLQQQQSGSSVIAVRGVGGGSSAVDIPPPHVMRRWELSSAQIRRAATKGLIRGGDKTMMSSSASSSSPRNNNNDANNSPRYRPLPHEEQPQQQSEDGQQRSQTSGGGALPHSRSSSATIYVQSLSRPITAGPARPPSVLELSRRV